MDNNEEEMKQALQGIIDSTNELIETIGKMDWERIETLGETIASLAVTLKTLSKVN